MVLNVFCISIGLVGCQHLEWPLLVIEQGGQTVGNKVNHPNHGWVSKLYLRSEWEWINNQRTQKTLQKGERETEKQAVQTSENSQKTAQNLENRQRSLKTQNPEKPVRVQTATVSEGRKMKLKLGPQHQQFASLKGHTTLIHTKARKTCVGRELYSLLK